MKTVIKITLGILLAGVVMVGGCAALFSAVASDPEVKKSVAQLDRASKDVDDMTGENDRHYASRMRQVQLGDSRAEVIRLLGKPRDRQVMRTEFGKSEFVYYGSWQISLSDGVVDGKSRF